MRLPKAVSIFDDEVFTQKMDDTPTNMTQKITDCEETGLHESQELNEMLRKKVFETVTKLRKVNIEILKNNIEILFIYIEILFIYIEILFIYIEILFIYIEILLIYIEILLIYIEILFIYIDILFIYIAQITTKKFSNAH